MDNQKIIIDGNSIFFKMYFAHLRTNLTNSTGFSTGAIYGFLSYLNKLKGLFNYDLNNVIVTFDNKDSKMYRRKLYPGYKGGRTKQKDDLYLQLETLTDLLKYEGISVMSVPGFEADDLVFLLSKYYNEKKEKVMIISRDHDLLQSLQFENTKMYLDGKESKIIDQTEFIKLYNFPITHFLTYKSLLGDSSDNVKGVKGVGKKTAEKFINHLIKENIKLSTLLLDESIILEDDKMMKVLEKIREEKDIFLLNRKILGPLNYDIEKLFKEGYLKKEENEEKANELYEFLGIKKRLQK